MKLRKLFLPHFGRPVPTPISSDYDIQESKIRGMSTVANM